MALPRRRPVKRVNYAEPSSDEGLSEPEDSDPGLSRMMKNAPTRKGLRTNRKRSYRESSTEGDGTSEGDAIAKPHSQHPQMSFNSWKRRKTGHADPPQDTNRSDGPFPQRSTRKRNISYLESSAEEDINSEEEVIPKTQSRRALKSRNPSPSKTDRGPPAKRSRVVTGSQGSNQRKPADRKRQSNYVENSQVTRPSNQLSHAIRSDRKRPDWTVLEYDIVVDILTYAALPLHDENFVPTSSVAWLAKAARVCKAWSKPALSALYRVPPILDKRHHVNTRLIDQLTGPQTDTVTNYPVQVRRLEIDRTRISALSTYLCPLVSSLKAVKEIDLFDPRDRPPYREGKERIRRWFYPDELFAAMEQAGIQLRSWSWNSTYCNNGPLWMKEIHGNRAMRTLRNVTLCKFAEDERRTKKTSDEEDKKPRVEELIASSLAVLPYLESISFETCTAVNATLLPLLPDKLVHLSITNCEELTSDALQAYLVSHGSHLKTLTLNHNQALGLSFLVGLKQWAPQLEVLRVDTHFYNTLATSATNEPLYDELLCEGEIPTWPSTLRILDMQFLRNWSSTAAVAFFQSLIDSAEELPHLRELTITAIVDIEWRQRAEFRKKWTRAFEKVFKRKWEPPSPHLMSIDAYNQWKESQENPFQKNVIDLQEHASMESSSDEGPIAASRRATRSERWNSRRLRARPSPGRYTGDSSTDDSSDETDKEDAEPSIKFVQGRCHTVEFKIDNSRPQEQIFDEEDFLDDENSEEDEEWNGEDRDEDDGLAW